MASAKTLKHNFFLVEMNGANETSVSKRICGSMEISLVHYICSCCFLGSPVSPLRWMSCFFGFFVWMAVFSNQGSLLRELDAGWWPWQVTCGVDVLIIFEELGEMIREILKLVIASCLIKLIVIYTWGTYYLWLMTFLQGVRPVDEFQARYSSETFKSQISKITKLTNKSTLDPVGLTKLASNQKRVQLPEIDGNQKHNLFLKKKECAKLEKLLQRSTVLLCICIYYRYTNIYIYIVIFYIYICIVCLIACLF